MQMRRFLHYIAGIFVHPVSTIDALAAEQSVRFGVLVAVLGVVQVWGNMALFAAFGYDWLGTRQTLPDPTYVGGFGYLRVSPGQWLPFFTLLVPVLALFQLTVVPGVAQLLSRAWHGRGRFEQMVNVLTFATVPSLVVGWLNEWLTGVPMNLLSGHPYWFVGAMQGDFGPVLATIWTIYAVAVYAIPWGWGVVLGTVGVRRVQGIPLWAAALTMLIAFSLYLLIESTFVR
jgi:hypothetical protein